MRADVYLFASGNAKSRQGAKALIESGNVLLDGVKILKPSFNIDENAEHTVLIINKPKFVSRGGEKLDFALSSFGVDVSDKSCIDIGASTGGFTDCLLQRGARSVCAVDSGHSQLDISIAGDERVTPIEKYNARFMQESDFPHKFDIAVMDVSFISQTLIHRGIFDVLHDGGMLISLVKPQFECGRAALNSQGVVRSAADRMYAIERVVQSAVLSGFSVLDITRSPIEGGSGNAEYLLLSVKSDAPQNMLTTEKIKSVLSAKK